MTVETKNLTKYYWMGKEKVAALDAVDLKVEEGGFISAVGPFRLREVHAFNCYRMFRRTDEGGGLSEWHPGRL
jgi:hypothetical protein